MALIQRTGESALQKHGPALEAPETNLTAPEKRPAGSQENRRFIGKFANFTIKKNVKRGPNGAHDRTQHRFTENSRTAAAPAQSSSRSIAKLPENSPFVIFVIFVRNLFAFGIQTRHASALRRAARDG